MAAITIVMRTMGTSDTAEMCDMPRRSRWSFCQITHSARQTGMADRRDARPARSTPTT